MKDAKQFIIGLEIIICILALGFFIGWLFPVEGPYDYVYDEYASQPARKNPSKAAPLKPYQIIIDVNDLSEEDFEALQEVFMNK
jgi:cellulose synthase/poly-beta-1,6-N-acetylglucosamine synthase-like glycosyltransferase